VVRAGRTETNCVAKIGIGGITAVVKMNEASTMGKRQTNRGTEQKQFTTTGNNPRDKFSLQVTSCLWVLLVQVVALLAFAGTARPQLEIIYNFDSKTFTAPHFPHGNLVQGTDGFLYGTTQDGGTDNAGALFKIRPDGSDFSIIKSFQCGIANNECFPEELIQLADGFLYGTTGGSGNLGGTIFKIRPDGSSFSVIKSFQCGVTDGCSPLAGLIQLADGFLYGTTQRGAVRSDQCNGNLNVNLSRARFWPEFTEALGSIDFLGKYDFTQFQAIKNSPGGFKETRRERIFHYAISAHFLDQVKRPTGVSSFVSSDFIIALGDYSTDVSKAAGTLMHELGHNLGLRHGGNEPRNHKPNYLSIMNYTFQLRGLYRNGMSGDFDYSWKALPTLTETNLNESIGLGQEAAGYGTRHFCSFGQFGFWLPVFKADGPIDWNCDSTYSAPVVFDINRSGIVTESLHGYDDWSNIKLVAGAIGQFGAELPDPQQSETDELPLTPEVLEQYPPWAESFEVTIDIKPGSSKTPINLRSRGLIPVAILSTPDFDVRVIDPLSVRFGPGGSVEAHKRGHFEDVNGDGLMDLVLHFDSFASGLEAGQSVACLTGSTLTAGVVRGCDVIKILR
jgi:hypothetical protein